jgi:predicted deacylase
MTAVMNSSNLTTSNRRDVRAPRRWGGALIAAVLGLATVPTSLAETWGPIDVVGRSVAPGESKRFPFIPDRSYQSSFLNSPVFVARGVEPGPTLCLTAGIHGDELNGVEVARRAFADTDATQLKGTLIVLPAVNAEGVRSGNRYLSDRRDLNRAFPGRAGGSIASLIAYAVTTNILVHCGFVVDLHTASDRRANVPQIRADLSSDAVRDLALHFGRGLVVGGAGPSGSWRREAVAAGVPAIIYEAGEPLRFEEDVIEEGRKGVVSVMAYLGMIDGKADRLPDDRVFTKSTWVRAGPNESGFFFADAKLGDQVREGDHLGRIVDPLTDEVRNVVAPRDGTVIGMAVPRPVLSGYGLVHLAWR